MNLIVRNTSKLKKAFEVDVSLSPILLSYISQAEQTRELKFTDVTRQTCNEFVATCCCRLVTSQVM